ncbi:glycosyltransferase [Cellulosimicrobium cellulans]|uniref:glycosyltransferase n=1 Tax=Cellulosimicrobium cellulans TaxID=1710 RepID=UPI00130EAADC|nr:glycosyltransferase [Cellulosimicrobium cellulans]
MRLLRGQAAPAETDEAGTARAVAAWDRRLPLLAAALDRPVLTGTPAADGRLGEALAALVEPTDRAQVWLALAVLTGRLPEEDAVLETARAAEFDAGALADAVAAHTTPQSAGWAVRVATGATLVDVAHTASTTLTTGIQRVARETARRWLRDHACEPVSWTQGFEAPRELTAVEHDRIVSARAAEEDRESEQSTVVVPWRSRYLLPELAAEPGRAARLRAFARFSGNRTGVIGFDCVPITSAETTQLGFAGVFAGNLAAVRWFDRVATISEAARTEYTGWTRMLGAIGLTGPQVEAVLLPVEAPESTAEDLAAARRRFVVPGLPLVLVVGSHEPRKNHAAVLQAAELLWREGHEFSLSFVGGNAWDSEAFQARLAAAQAAGRPVETGSKIADAHLWAAYRLARFTVFPSFNEGYGLPVAESLAVGTPAITSGFGSMEEIAAGGGALLVDPHDDASVADAMRRLLTEPGTVRRLRAEAAARPVRTWDDYAAETWASLTS